ncbi:MAG: hypothetical protein ACOYLG_13215 [Chitinophagaceae bacterium]
MRKLILLLALTMGFMACQEKEAKAQTGSLILYSSDNNATDTLSNAATIYLTSTSLAKYTNNADVTVDLKVTNISGTSTFKAIWQTSMDGTNWSNHFMVAGTDGIHCDTLQVTSAAPAYHKLDVAKGSIRYSSTGVALNTNTPYFRYGRWMIVGTGTQSTIVASKLYIRRPD